MHGVLKCAGLADLRAHYLAIAVLAAASIVAAPSGAQAAMRALFQPSHVAELANFGAGQAAQVC